MYDTIIIGAGIAGMTSAIYAARKKMEFKFISKKVGGQFLESGEVLNYPGIPQTTGIEFEQKMEEQLKFNEVKAEVEDCKKIEKKGDNFLVTTDKGEYETRSVIITTGAHPRELGVPGEKEFKNKGITYCSICDGPLFQGMDVAIIGGGDSALEAVDFMDNIAKKIYLININEELKAHEYLIERLEKNKKVEILNSAKTTEILGDKMVSGLKVEQDGKERELKVQGVIVEIGRIPDTDFVKDLVDTDEHQHIAIDCTTATSVEGIFAAGDCASGHEYQYVIAAGQGCMALLKAARYLAKKG